MNRAGIRRSTAAWCAVMLAAAGTTVLGTHTAGAALTPVAEVSAGVYHTCARLADGTAQCWGRNGVGELGDGTRTAHSLPATVKNSGGTGALSGVTQISTGGGIACALLADTTIQCWGDNFYGELGIGTKSGPESCGTYACSTLPVAVKNPAGSGSLTGVTQVSVGDVFACAVMADTTAVCWGDAGALGRGAGADPTLPGTVVVNGTSTALTGITEISAGRGHACAVIADGTARCWGDNLRGQLGDGTTTSGYATVLNNAGTGPLTTVVDIAAGYRHTCAALADQTARCWGLNSVGKVGDGTSNTRHLPVTVLSDATHTALTGVVEVVTGSEHSCARLSDSTVRCWGSDGWYQLGTGAAFRGGSSQSCADSQACSTEATLVRAPSGDPLTGVTQLGAVAGYDTCVTLTGGTARCWGQNTYNEIGDGTDVHRCAPAEVGTQGPLATVPPAPTNVSATKGVDKAIVHWAKQVGDCGSPVITFTITASPGGDHISVSAEQNWTYQTSAEFPRTPGHTYRFTVTATNYVGTSPPSALSNAVVPVGEPSAPTRVRGVPGNGRATVSWTKPTLTNGSAITGYSVTPLRNGSPFDARVFHSTATRQTISGLKNNTAYTFQVAAINGYGTSPKSVPSPAIRVGAPAAPTSVKVTARKSTPRALVVTYSAGANNGAAITKFAATCTSANGGTTKSASHAGAKAAPIAVTGVTAGKTYVCRVAATNSRGTGPSSAPSNAVVA